MEVLTLPIENELKKNCNSLTVMNYIAKNVRYVGVDDDNLDLFEAQYPLTKGISYNSYLVEDEKIAIIDAVDCRRCADWLALLEDSLAGREPDYLVVQHVEPDHSGSIAAVMERYPGLKVVATAKGQEILGNFFEDVDFSSRVEVATDGGTLSIGQGKLQFFTAPMVHWPEVMMTLYDTGRVLFSADAFGTFATPSPAGDWDDEARRYYANIVGKYGPSVKAIMAKLRGLDFSTIAPLHGPVLNDNLAHYWKLYKKWSGYEPEKEGVLVVYASVYGGTAEAARRLASMIKEENGDIEVVVMDLCRHDVSYAVGETFRLSRLALCSVTYDASLFPAMYNFLHHLKMKNMCNRRVGLVENGSWAPIAGKLMRDMLSQMKGMEIVEPMVTLRSRLHHDDVARLRALAAALARDDQ